MLLFLETGSFQCPLKLIHSGVSKLVQTDVPLRLIHSRVLWKWSVLVSWHWSIPWYLKWSILVSCKWSIPVSCNWSIPVPPETGSFRCSKRLFWSRKVHSNCLFDIDCFFFLFFFGVCSNDCCQWTWPHSMKVVISWIDLISWRCWSVHIPRHCTTSDVRWRVVFHELPFRHSPFSASVEPTQCIYVYWTLKRKKKWFCTRWN